MNIKPPRRIAEVPEMAEGTGVESTVGEVSSRQETYTFSAPQGRKERVGPDAAWYVGSVAERETASSNSCM